FPPTQQMPILKIGEQGVPAAAVPVLPFESPPPEPARQRQSTVVLTWGEDDPPAPTQELRVLPRGVAVSARDVAMPYDSPLMGTMALTTEQAATPMPMPSPFRIAEPGAAPPTRSADIPGAPWATGVPPLAPRSLDLERTGPLALGALLPDDLVDDP